MTERITRTSVEFQHAFRLPGVEGQQPAGHYNVLTTEEQIDGLSFIAYRRLSTTIALGGTIAGMRAEQVTPIDPEDLSDALAKDSEGPYVAI
jgi:hypothetical protein